MEVGFYIDFTEYKKDIISNYSYSRRRHYRYSLKNNFTFKELSSTESIIQFYKVLVNNYEKFGKTPIHTVEELLDFKNNRLKDETCFYGVFMDDQMIAGAMIFCFGNSVFHTQYLAVDQTMKSLFVNAYLYTSLIEAARDMGYRYLSFGTSTLEGGQVLNNNLALFKEGFGTKQYNNITYRKTFGDE